MDFKITRGSWHLTTKGLTIKSVHVSSNVTGDINQQALEAKLLKMLQKDYDIMLTYTVDGTEDTVKGYDPETVHLFASKDELTVSLPEAPKNGDTEFGARDFSGQGV